MKTPDDLLMWLNNGAADTLKVEFFQTGTDTADTRLVLKRGPGRAEKTIIAHKFNSLLRDRHIELGPDHCSIVRLTDAGRSFVEEYKKFLRTNQTELSEYARLKAKFEDAK